MKKRVNPLPPERTKWFLENPQKFNIDKLEANEMLQGSGSPPIAKIPQDRDRIRRTVDEHNRGSIELVIGRETDPETGEIREETVRIGTSISGHLPGMMIATDVYHKYYDIYGNLRNDPLREMESTPDAKGGPEGTVPHGPEGTVPPGPDLAQRLKERVAEELEEKNEIRLGGTTLVRLPKIPGIRILPPNQKGLSQVEYKYDQWYDPVTQQSRNRKRIIGQLSDEYPDAMVPNKRYYEIFNITTGLTWKEEAKLDGIDIEESLEELRKNVEERKKKEEEDKRQREEDERLKKLYGENSPEIQEAASRRLRKIFSELHDRYDEQDRQDYIDLGIEDEYDTEDDSTGPEAENNDNNTRNSNMADPMIKENNNEENKESRKDDRMDDSKDDIHYLYNQVSREKERTAILMKILGSVTKTISNQAKKHPDHIINTYKARKINEILIELRIKYQGSGYEDLLELIREPEEVEKDGQKFIDGMTYSDAEVLLSHYATIIEHIRLENR